MAAEIKGNQLFFYRGTASKKRRFVGITAALYHHYSAAVMVIHAALSFFHQLAVAGALGLFDA